MLNYSKQNFHKAIFLSIPFHFVRKVTLAAWINSQQAPQKQAEETEASRSEFARQLSDNTLAHAAEVSRAPLGDVLLTGATGFLGVHILRELIFNKTQGRITPALCFSIGCPL